MKRTKKIALIGVSILALSEIGYAASLQNNSDILLKVWNTASKKACSAEMQAAFSDSKRLELAGKLKSLDKIDDLAEVLNPFLFSLGKSHTEFMTTSSEGYYLFKSHEAISKPKLRPAPKLINPGVQLGKDKDGYLVREVLDGFPASIAGLMKKDRIVSIDGVPFAGSWGVDARLASIQIQRLGKVLDIKTKIRALDWSQSFQEATKKSVKILTSPNGQKIGYIHLWSGTHPDSAKFLAQSVAKLKKKKIASLILDLRGGYGGAWWDHLDPFFADTSTYMKMEIESGGETETVESPFKKNKNYYAGPMAILINEGVRSGKEALAYQFKKTKRATLIGEKTPGYFTTGQYFYVDEPLDYIFYLCVYQLKLDGNIIEGIGIQPDLAIPFDSTGDQGDSQLSRAINYLSEG